MIVSKIPFFFAPLKAGDVVAFHQPGYGTMIKLVEHVNQDSGELLVIGTQPDSVDSRVFGAVRQKDVFGKVIWHVAKPQ